MMMRSSVLVTHKHDHAAAFPGPKTSRARVENSHVLPSQRAQFGEPGEFEGIQTQVNAASDGNIDVSALQRRASCGYSQQAGRTSPINGVAAAVQIEVVADPSGNGIGKPPCQRFLCSRREWGLVQSFNLAYQFVQITICRGNISFEYGCQYAAHVRPAQTQEIGAGKLTSQRIADVYPQALALAGAGIKQPSIFQRLPGDIQGQPMRQVG